jgi:hypothetical protein
MTANVGEEASRPQRQNAVLAAPVGDVLTTRSMVAYAALAFDLAPLVMHHSIGDEGPEHFEATMLSRCDHSRL